MGDAGLLEDLVFIAKSVDMTAAKTPFSTTMKAAPGITTSVAPDAACPTTVTPVSSLECVFGLLARLCDGCKANATRFRRAGGVSVLVAWLRFPTGDPASKPQVVVAVVDCLWSAVAFSTSSENRFVAEVRGMCVQ